MFLEKGQILFYSYDIAPLKVGAIFVTKDGKKDLVYYRENKGNMRVFRLPITRTGEYIINPAPNKIQLGSLKEFQNSLKTNIELPEKQHNFFKKQKPQFVLNPVIQTPARIFPLLNKIEVSKDFFKLPYQWRIFILFHEYGHLFYADEEKADLFAMKMFYLKGFNEIEAFNCLMQILKRSPEHINRIKNIFYAILKNKKK